MLMAKTLEESLKWQGFLKTNKSLGLGTISNSLLSIIWDLKILESQMMTK